MLLICGCIAFSFHHSSLDVVDHLIRLCIPAYPNHLPSSSYFFVSTFEFLSFRQFSPSCLTLRRHGLLTQWTRLRLAVSISCQVASKNNEPVSSAKRRNDGDSNRRPHPRSKTKNWRLRPLDHRRPTLKLSPFALNKEFKKVDADKCYPWRSTSRTRSMHWDSLVYI